MSRLRSQSTKRRNRSQERRDAVLTAMARDGYTCQALHVLDHPCTGELVGHEPHKRSQGGDPYEVDEILTVCQWVNDWVEREPAKARELGLSVHGWCEWSWTEHWQGLVPLDRSQGTDPNLEMHREDFKAPDIGSEGEQ